MPTAKYCDFINGSDTTGDGSKENPYQWIGAASVGGSPGDEVRCAKTPAHTTNLLGATWTWTHGSQYVTAPSDPTGVVAVGDNVRPAAYPDRWARVTGVTSSPARIQLSTVYYGPTLSAQTDLMGCAVGDFSVLPGSTNEIVVSGSDGSPIKVSGGWNLSTETQDGETWLNSFKPGQAASRYGYGVYHQDRAYLTIEDVGLFGFLYGVYSKCYSTAVGGGDLTFNRVKTGGCQYGQYMSHLGTGYPGDLVFTDCVDSCSTYALYLYRLDHATSVQIDGCTFYDEPGQAIFSNEMFGYQYASYKYATLDIVTLTDATFDGCSGGIGVQNSIGALAPTGTITRCMYPIYLFGSCEDTYFDLANSPIYDTRGYCIYSGGHGARIDNIIVDGSLFSNPALTNSGSGLSVYNITITNWPSTWRLAYSPVFDCHFYRLKCNQITDGYARSPTFNILANALNPSYRPLVTVEGIWDPTDECYVEQFVGYRDQAKTITSRDWTLLYDGEPSCRVTQCLNYRPTITAFDVYAVPGTAATVKFQARGDAAFVAMTYGYFQMALEQGGKIVTAWTDVDFTDDAWTENEISIGAEDWENGAGLLTLLLRTGNPDASAPEWNIAAIEVN